MTKNKNTIKELLQQFVSTSSYVNNRSNEYQIQKIIELFFEENFPKYKKVFIPVEKERNNILFTPKTPKVIFCCHLDTVLPSKEKHTEIYFKGDRAYGLGTKDMKGGWISSILAVKSLPEELQNNVGFLFYCDEEYNQKGMDMMLQNTEKIPKTVQCLISPESRFNLAYGCRGYSTFEIEITGKRSHTARPQQGINAGELLFTFYEHLSKLLNFSNKLGDTTLTLVGANIGIKDNKNKIITQTNSVPDYTEGTFSLRISNNLLTQKKLISLIEKCKKQLLINNLTYKIINFRSPSNIAPNSLIKKFLNSAKDSGFNIELADPSLAGYNDIAIISDKCKIPMLGFGPYGEGNHGPDEWVSISSIQNTSTILAKFISNL